MNRGTSRVLILEDNDEDFHTIEMARAKLEDPIQLQRYTRAEPLVDDLRNGRIPPPALALFDLRMPGDGGIGALQEIKQNQATATTPVVIISTSSNLLDVRQCYEMNANAFHVKRMDTREMIDMMVGIFRYWLNMASLSTR